MTTKGFTIRERRKIYEDAVCLLQQTDRIRDATKEIKKERALCNLLNNQTDRCASILITSLGYVESIHHDGTHARKVLVPIDGDMRHLIDKDAFVRTIKVIHKDKSIKDLVWKAMAKRDPKSIEILNTK
jgi:hypothetical protein